MKKVLFIFLIFCFSLTIISCSEDKEESTTDTTAPVIVVIPYRSYVAVGNSGTILTSSDGTTWTSRTSGTSNTLNGVTYRE